MTSSTSTLSAGSRIGAVALFAVVAAAGPAAPGPDGHATESDAPRSAIFHALRIGASVRAPDPDGSLDDHLPDAFDRDRSESSAASTQPTLDDSDGFDDEDEDAP